MPQFTKTGTTIAGVIYKVDNSISQAISNNSLLARPGSIAYFSMASGRDAKKKELMCHRMESF